MVIKNLKESILDNEELLEILKYSHFMPTKEKLLRLLKKYYENKDILPFASINEDKIVGIIVVQKISCETYEIIDISVASNYRKKGIASKLIDYVTKHLGIKTILAETDKDAVEFYKKYGFKTEILETKGYKRYKCILKIN